MSTVRKPEHTDVGSPSSALGPWEAANRLARFVRHRTGGKVVAGQHLRRLDAPLKAGVVVLRVDPTRPELIDSLGRLGSSLTEGAYGVVVLQRQPATWRELREGLRSAGLWVHFSGSSTGTSTWPGPRDTLVVSTVEPPRQGGAPEGYGVLAIMTTFNEADVIDGILDRLYAQGVRVHVVDNWSTDDTFERVQRHMGRAVTEVEQFPESPPGQCEQARLLRRVEGIAATREADWFIHHDADELRTSPWMGVPLVDALHHVAELGYNAVDHTVVLHPPVDERFRAGMDVTRVLRRFKFGREEGDFRQVKAWKAQPGRVDLVSSGGHDVAFRRRRVFPFNFLLRHYPIRSQAHGEQKLLHDRRERWSPAERQQGWHSRYADADGSTDFVRDPTDLELYRPATFHQRYLFERLGRIGLRRP